MPMRLGVLGLGSVFWGPYASLIQKLDPGRQGRAGGRVRRRRRQAEGDATRFGIDTDLSGPEEMFDRDDVDAVLVLTSMNEHGDLALAGLEHGKHVLVEKPMATSLEQARTLVDAAAASDRLLVCAPHIVLSPTYQEMHAAGAGRRGRAAVPRPRALRLVRAVVGPVVLPAGRRLAVRPRRLQPDQPVRLLRLGEAGHRHGRHRHPGARGRGRGDEGAGRRQRPRRARLRRLAVRVDRVRVHDPEVPLPGHRAVRPRRRAADARRRLGSRGLRAVDATTAARGRSSARPTATGRGPTGCGTWSTAPSAASRR